MKSQVLNHIITVAKTNTDNVHFKGHFHKCLGGREHSVPSENSCGQAEFRREEKKAFIRKMECSQGKSASRMTSEEKRETVRDTFFPLR